MLSRRVFTLFRMALWLGAVFGIGCAQARDVHVGVYVNEPKIFIDPAGQPAGIFIDILQRIAAREGWTLRYDPCDWQACLESLQAGTLDLMPDVAISPERDQLFDFHKTPVLSSWSGVFARKGLQINSIFDLEGKRVALLGGSIQEKSFTVMIAGFGIKAQVLPVQSYDQAFAMVTAGEADAAIANNLYGEFNALRYEMHETSVVFQPARLFYAAKQGTNQDLLAAIDRQLMAWQDEPGSEYFQILSKWRGKSPAAAVPAYVWQAGMGLMILLLLTGGAVVVLRWQINVKTHHLSSETSRTQAILNAIPDLLFEVDSDGRIYSYHSPRTELLAAPPEAFLGRKFSEILPPDVSTICLAGLREADEAGYSIGKQYGLQLAGGLRFFELSISRKPPEPWQSTRFIFLARDITARKEAEEVLARDNEHLSQLVNERTAALSLAKDSAEAANRAKSTFLANMSHELRTPMTAIMGMVDLVLRKNTDPKQIDQLTKAKLASQHLLAVINNVLDISKIEAERLTLEHLQFRFREVLDTLVGVTAQKASEKGLMLRVDLPAEIAKPIFLGDPTRLGQILLNFVANAVKFTERGEIIIRGIVIENNPGDALLRWEISDTGIGISADDLQRLFTAFEQADGSMTRKYGGTGLGLAISKRLVTLMGGEVGVTSQPGGGSTFWFTVRVNKDTGAVPRSSTAGQKSAEHQLKEQFAGTRILLAEDEPISREVAHEMLEEVGLRIDVAEDGAIALSLAQQNRYALILMDMQMPNLNGADATRAIRGESLNRETPILAMTANAFDEDRQMCLRAGMNDHIAKPVDPDALFETLLTWLSKGRG